MAPYSLLYDIPTIVGLIGNVLSIVLSVLSIVIAFYLYRESDKVLARNHGVLADVAAATRNHTSVTNQVTAKALDALVVHRTVNELEAASRFAVADALWYALSDQPPDKIRAVQQEALARINATTARVAHDSQHSGHYSEWTGFVRCIDALERSNQFVSIKWLHQTVFRTNPKYQEALTVGLRLGLLLRYPRRNPRSSTRPIDCCQLNHQHPIVQQCLGE